MSLQKYEEAILIFELNIQLDSKNFQAYYNKGNDIKNFQQHIHYL